MHLIGTEKQARCVNTTGVAPMLVLTVCSFAGRTQRRGQLWLA